MKVIALDIDGVLNTMQTIRENGYDALDRSMLIRFVAIVKATDAKIVLSTSWRFADCLKEVINNHFAEFGIADRIIGETPDFCMEPRAKEIKAWLDEHPDVDKFAIIDDDEDAGEDDIFQQSFFKTDPTVGLTTDIAIAIIKHLNG